MGWVTTPVAEHALADLAFRLGAAQVRGLSPAERDLATAVPQPLPRAGAPATLSANRAAEDLARGLRNRIRAGEDPLGRVYAGGLAKFEPGEMERLLVPDPSLLTASR